MTQTVLDGAIDESSKAGMTLEAFLKVWCLRGSQGLQADWIKPQERSNGQQAPPSTATRKDRQLLGAAYMLGLKPSPSQTTETIDVDARTITTTAASPRLG